MVSYLISPARGPVMRGVSVTLDTCKVEMVASQLSNVVAFTMDTTMRQVAVSFHLQ